SMLEEARPDVVAVVSNPHGISADDTIPVFGVFRGESVSDRMAERPAGNPTTAAMSGPPPVVTSRAPRAAQTFPACPPMAEHLIDSLIEDGFDVANTVALRAEHGLDEAFRTLYDYYEPTGTVPIVPVILSRYLPSQATPAR